jgi:hypothetical protein
VNQRSRKTPIDLAAESVDMDFDHIRLAFPIALPELMVEHLAREDLILVSDE